MSSFACVSLFLLSWLHPCVPRTPEKGRGKWNDWLETGPVLVPYSRMQTTALLLCVAMLEVIYWFQMLNTLHLHSNACFSTVCLHKIGQFMVHTQNSVRWGNEIILGGVTNKYALKACPLLFGHMTAVNSYIFNFIFLILSLEFILSEQ